jgi:Flp pilus assembly protein TadD
MAALSALDAALRDGDLPQAREAATLLVQAEPQVWRYWAILADIEAQLGNAHAALAALERAVEFNPSDPSLGAMAVEFHLACGNHGEALAVALALDPSALAADRADRLGTLLTHAGHSFHAIRYFEHAVAVSPETVSFRFNLATAQHMVGQSEAVELNLDVVLAAQPLDGQAQLLRSRLKRQTERANHVAELQASLRRAPAGLDRIAIGFALAKELEDLGCHTESFAALSGANDAVRATMAYDVAADTAVLDALGRDGQSAAVAATNAGGGGRRGEGAIFVMGLPRSGTTLVERILASHPEIAAAGETGLFAALTVEAAGGVVPGAPADRLAFVRRTEALNHAELGSRFLRAIADLTGGALHFTEKTPDNCLYAGLIGRALPGCRFIVLERHPMDSCYAMYKTLFNRAYPFSYDLGDLADYYIGWRALMDRWKTRLGPSLVTVSYERLVRHQEQESRRILAHCGLAWDARVLDFHDLKAPVSTASTAQVREPIHDRPVGLWRQYEKQLGPLRDRLVAAGIDVAGP